MDDIDPKEAEQQIQDQVESLPPEIQEAIASSDMEQKIQAIGAAHKLHIDQIQELWNFTMLVMLGFARPENFQNMLIDQVHIPPEDAKGVAEEINTQVFMAIQELMKKSARQASGDIEEEIEPAGNVANTANTPAYKPIATPAVDVPKPYTPPTEAPPKPIEYKADPYREPPI